MQSGQVEESPAHKTIAVSLGEARENEGFLHTTVFTFRIQGQPEGCPAFFLFLFLSDITAKKILHFYYNFLYYKSYFFTVLCSHYLSVSAV